MPSSARRRALAVLGASAAVTAGFVYAETALVSLSGPRYERALFGVLFVQPGVIALVCGRYGLGLSTAVAAGLIPPFVGTLAFRILVPYPGSYGVEQLSGDVGLAAAVSLVVVGVTACVYALTAKAEAVALPSSSGSG